MPHRIMFAKVLYESLYKIFKVNIKISVWDKLCNNSSWCQKIIRIVNVSEAEVQGYIIS